MSGYFNPLSPHGERPGRPDFRRVGGHDFNPLSPHGERPTSRRWPMPPRLFQSTLPAWGETPIRSHPRTDGGISIHSPRMGRDLHGLPVQQAPWEFQSTLPAWGETLRVRDGTAAALISIHSPRMGRDQKAPNGGSRPGAISIHSPRMGRDHGQKRCGLDREDFNPLSPHGERPWIAAGPCLRSIISIHSPRMGRDRG